MRTCSLMIALGVVLCVGALFMHPGRRPPPEPPFGFGHRIKVHNGKIQATVTTAPPAVVAQAAPAAVPDPDPPAPANALPEPQVVTMNSGGWHITGGYKTTAEAARKSALELAGRTLQEHLRTQETPFHWEPSPEFLERQAKHLKIESKDFGGTTGVMYCASLDLQLTSEAWTEIARDEREAQAQIRMLGLGKVVAMLTLLLAAVAGYFRLDDLTKGYYTGWLRLAAGCLAGAALLLMLA